MPAVVAALAACAGGGPSARSAATSLASPEPGRPSPRRPDAVVLPYAAAVPPPADRADARGVLTLRVPPSDAEIAGVVTSFFQAWQRESLDGLTALLTSDAGPLDGRGRGRAALVEDWRQRLRAHAYSRLRGLDLVRADRIARFAWYDLPSTAGRAEGPERPPELAPGEVLVRVPIEVTEAGGDRLFGDVASMVLRRDHGELRIAAYAESAASPL